MRKTMFSALLAIALLVMVSGTAAAQFTDPNVTSTSTDGSTWSGDNGQVVVTAFMSTSQLWDAGCFVSGGVGVVSWFFDMPTPTWGRAWAAACFVGKAIQYTNYVTQYMRDALAYAANQSFQWGMNYYVVGQMCAIDPQTGIAVC